jgi:hypothetical protein
LFFAEKTGGRRDVGGFSVPLDSVEVKLFERDGELYVPAKSEGRQAKEVAMRRKRLARLLRKLRAVRRSLPARDQPLSRIGSAKTEADAR